METIMGMFIAIIVAGFIIWAMRAIVALIPMEPWLKSLADLLITILVVAVVLFYVLIPLIHLLASKIPAHL